MDFETLLKKISPRLKRIAKTHNGQGFFIDADDLYQEMCIYLWNRYKSGMPEGVNEAYIIKGCEFNILNYLRKNRDKASMVSIDQPVNGEGQAGRDILPDNSKLLEEILDRDMISNYVKNNGLVNKEKAVFLLLVEGRTVREVGRHLNISHVMVIKYKKRLIKKLRKVTRGTNSLLI